MSFEIWITFVAASTVLLLIPGPTVLLVLSYALSQGRRVAVATAAGVAFGDLIAISASLAGLGALVLASATLFTFIKWIGAAYLVYLGTKLLLNASSSKLGDVTENAAIPPSGVFGHAAAVTALNPKSIVFFIAFVPQFIVPTDPLFLQFAILIATFVGMAAVNALAYALMADRLRSKISNSSLLGWLSRLGAGALIAMGIATALARRSAA